MRMQCNRAQWAINVKCLVGPKGLKYLIVNKGGNLEEA